MVKVMGKPVKFVRYSQGLNLVKQNGYNATMPTFHSPPTKRGLFAFTWPYVDLFLLSGSFSRDKFQPVYDKPGVRRGPNSKKYNPDTFCDEEGYQLALPPRYVFTYTGPLWHHLKPNKYTRILAVKGDWYYSPFADFVDCLRKELHIMSKVANQYGPVSKPGRYMTTDHLEVFIDRKI